MVSIFFLYLMKNVILDKFKLRTQCEIILSNKNFLFLNKSGVIWCGWLRSFFAISLGSVCFVDHCFYRAWTRRANGIYIRRRAQLLGRIQIKSRNWEINGWSAHKWKIYVLFFCVRYAQPAPAHTHFLRI